MNFFEHQRRARKNTWLLFVWLVLSYTLVSSFVGFLLGFFFYFACFPLLVFQSVFADSDLKAFQTFGFFICGTFLVIFSISMFRACQLARSSGIKIATMLKARYLGKASASGDLTEKQFLNVVEEMSIAASVPRPLTFVLENDHTINAFTAGMNYEDAVICVTRGALEQLTRDELQGIIGHEFSHILNGDTRLNVRATGMVFGMECIAHLGKSVLKSKELKNSGNAAIFAFQSGKAAIFAFLLWLLGSVGLFFAMLIRAIISRQREFLADASAVQFTRNPEGLANALKKIGGMGSFLSAPSASVFSHFYFASGDENDFEHFTPLTCPPLKNRIPHRRGCIFSLLNTHPSLKKRILALEPTWDGEFIKCNPTPKLSPWVQPPQPKEETAIESQDSSSPSLEAFVGDNPNPARFITVAALLRGLDNMGTITDHDLEKARKILLNFPAILRETIDDQVAAQAMVFALLLDMGVEIKKAQIAMIRQDFLTANPEIPLERFREIALAVINLPRASRLPLMQLVLPTLRTLKAEDYPAFRRLIKTLVMADNKISWFEFNLLHLIITPLDRAFKFKKKEAHTHVTLAAIRPELEVVLSTLLYQQFRHDEKADVKATAALKNITEGSGGNKAALTYVPSNRVSYALLEKACDALQKASLSLRRVIIEMVIQCLKADGMVSSGDLETLHAFGAMLHLPFNPQNLLGEEAGEDFQK